MGYHVPDEFSVVGFDGMPVTNVSVPRLTTVNFPVHRIAKIACDLLIKRLEREDKQPEKNVDIVIVPKLIIRESTAAPRRKPRI
jgi:LacI family transcriptional regulator